MRLIMKKVFSIVLCFVIIFSSFSIHVFANNSTAKTTVCYFGDGSYCISTITEELSLGQSKDAKATTQTKTATKTSSFYDSTGAFCFATKVTGTFSYNGTTATATSASYGYSLGDEGWWFSSGSASYSGATATATCKFRYLLITRTLSSSLTCSPTGVLS